MEKQLKLISAMAQEGRTHLSEGAFVRCLVDGSRHVDDETFQKKMEKLGWHASEVQQSKSPDRILGEGECESSKGRVSPQDPPEHRCRELLNMQCTLIHAADAHGDAPMHHDETM